jgi:hypothetical protein
VEGLRKDSAFARHVAERLRNEPFPVADVGCWGGLDVAWRQFGDRLQAVGFDCVSAEVARLRAAETHPGVRYVDGFVGLPADHPLKQRIGDKSVWHQWPSYRLSYQRSVDIRTAKAEGRPVPTIEHHYRDMVWPQDEAVPAGGFDTDYAAAYQLFGPQDGTSGNGATPDQPLLLPAVLSDLGLTDLDMLKIDVDGPDHEILRSSTELLARPGLLAVGAEVCFYGSHDANDNSFHNIDRLMREKGFDLFGLTIRNYSSAALPWPYLDTYPALTSGGRPVQGDAIYIRDLASPVRKADAAAVSDEKLAKLAAIFALFGLPDEAAEVLLTHRVRLEGLIDIDAARELLAAQIQENDGTDLTYAEYIADFEAETPQFFDLYGRRSTWLADLQERADDAEAALVRERRARQDAEDRLQALQAELDALKIIRS